MEGVIHSIIIPKLQKSLTKQVLDSKDQIENLICDSELLQKLRPRSYVYKSDPEKRRVGYIAEEVVEVYPEFVNYHNGIPININWNAIVVFLVEEVKRLNRKIEEMENKINGDTT